MAIIKAIIGKNFGPVVFAENEITAKNKRKKLAKKIIHPLKPTGTRLNPIFDDWRYQIVMPISCETRLGSRPFRRFLLYQLASYRP